MQNVIKLINDIFSMSFDVVIPISGNIVAIMVAFLLFSIRYFTFRRKQRKFAGQQRHGKMTPRTRPPRQPAEKFPPLKAAQYCDEKIFVFMERAIERKRNSVGQRGNCQTDLLFCSNMDMELHNKTPKREEKETVI